MSNSVIELEGWVSDRRLDVERRILEHIHDGGATPNEEAISANPWPLIVHLLNRGFSVSVHGIDAARPRGPSAFEAHVGHPAGEWTARVRAPAYAQAVCEAGLMALDIRYRSY